MRRVTIDDDNDKIVYDEGDKSDGTNMGNYVSFTVWDKKSDFSAWRKGEAFKEAHGGTSIGAFMSTMISSALILQGPPRPAFYDGLMVKSVEPVSIPESVDGWRNVVADGKKLLPTECFVSFNQFFVPQGNAAAFEQRWANRESKLESYDGFVSFAMMRRDLGAKGHGIVELSENEPNYVAATIWEGKSSFDSWRKDSVLNKAHGDTSQEGKTERTLWSKPPEPVFYEGTLVISTFDGV